MCSYNRRMEVNILDYSNEQHGVFFLIDNKSFYASVESVELGLNPMKSILVVLSEQKNTGGGLVLAASPRAKRLFGISNVTRKRELPNDPRLVVVPPRMNLYIKKNLQINKIFTHFAAECDILPYSIDESIIDMTHSWRLFGNSITEVARKIQLTVRNELGLYTTVGIGENPIQAKLALDLLAKHNSGLIGQLNYKTFRQKLWPVDDLTSIWSIGQRTEKNLNRIGIHTMYDLAHYNPYELRRRMGIIGTQLYAIAWGIDRTDDLSKRCKPKNKSIGNSQVLPKDYLRQEEIETVIKEIGQQVASRIRHNNLQTSRISLRIGFSYAAIKETGAHGFGHEMTITPTDSTLELNKHLIHIFRTFWQGEAVRNISVSYSKLFRKTGDQLDLFHDYRTQNKRIIANKIIDEIRDRFGNTSIMYANSLSAGGTFLERASLVGGHNGGNTLD